MNKLSAQVVLTFAAEQHEELGQPGTDQGKNFPHGNSNEHLSQVVPGTTWDTQRTACLSPSESQLGRSIVQPLWRNFLSGRALGLYKNSVGKLWEADFQIKAV